MSIARHWTGLAKKERAEEYITHLKNDTFVKLRSIEGFQKAVILHREVEKGILFLIVTEWESLEAIKKFAGEQYEVAVVPALVQDIMLEYDSNAIHYNIHFTIP